MDAACVEADRLCARLLPVYACDFVLAENMPIGAWARLPIGWQSGVNEPVTVEWGRLPRAVRGAIAVNLATLRALGRQVA